jgi:hypothetical protein
MAGTCVAEVKKDLSTTTGFKWSCKCETIVDKSIEAWDKDEIYEEGDKVIAPACSITGERCDRCCKLWCEKRNHLDNPNKNSRAFEHGR